MTTPCARFVCLILVELVVQTYDNGFRNRLFTPQQHDRWLMSTGKVEGKVHVIEETKTYGQKGFRKRLVVLEQETGRFTNYLPMEFIQDACDDVDQMSVGDTVEISYRLSGRKWQRDPQSETKYFLSAEATGFTVKGASTEGTEPVEADVPYGETFTSDEDPPF